MGFKKNFTSCYTGENSQIMEKQADSKDIFSDENIEKFRKWLAEQDPQELVRTIEEDPDYLESKRLIQEMSNIPPEFLKMRFTGFGSSLTSAMSSMGR